MIDPEMIKNACQEAEQRFTGKLESAECEKMSAATEWQFKPEDYSDAGNAAAFAKWIDGQLLHCPALGWLIWTSQNWECADHQALSFATQYTDALLEDAIRNYGMVARSSSSGSQDEKAAKAYLTHAQKTRSKRSMDAFLKLSENKLYVALDDLDADGYKLNCPSGLVDLRTGRIITHAPEQLTMKMAACTPSKQGAENGSLFWMM